MTYRSCIRCGRRVENASYCKAHDPRAHYKTPGYRALQRSTKAYIGYPCPLCNVAMIPPLRSPSVDHLIPVLQGGDDSPSNVRVICKRCNETKRGRPR